jgi:DNA (cytosine-5)-methyltransferase 1
MKIGAIDLFCGIGGLSYGFRKQGFEVLAGIDLDDSCRYAFETNIGCSFLAKSIVDVKAKELVKIYNRARVDCRVLIGCAPCQPFSIYSGKYRRRGEVDHRWELLREFARLTLEVQPDVISMENVPRLRLHPIFEEFVSDLRSADYKVTYDILRCEQFGVPQKRSRLVLFASRHGEIQIPTPTHIGRVATVRDAIGHLPSVSAGEAHPSDRLHGGRSLTPLNLFRIRATKQGGGWKDWDKSMQLACHRKNTGRSFRSVYGRMSWDKPAPVITTQCLGIGNGRFGHPKQNRAITIREAALLQSFPKRFRFLPPREPIVQERLARHIGNAVPVKLATVIAKSIRQHLRTLSFT